MTDEEFLNLVSEMRGAQNNYFRNRTLTMLNICKSLEKHVDATQVQIR